ncbi:hypothetical protein DNU06_15055 [Putridiphycobacter roseus]|uniref:PPM-type phosphatase domain-containing protein n=1 Tax=Putridiphycobacter roseus TaxID=2219161 RepID=A0A2W1MX75_9FLAO|nr:SpoIIE family protein phosphatase [Putridiphycobacter roseus]PZE15964.1 hypothetical protein DNU06_15055 [Putridiphycobacter roseus]
MLKKQYFKLKVFLLGAEFENKLDLFEKVKTELIFNLLLIFSFIYSIGFIKILVFGYWYLFFIRIIGLIIFVFAFIALKKQQHFRIPSAIWSLGIMVLGIQGLLVTNGQITYANLGYSLLNISIIFLMLGKTLRIIAYVYYLLFLTYGLAVYFQLIQNLKIGLDFGYEQTFFNQNIAFAMMPFFLLIYVLYAFITYEFRVRNKLNAQIEIIKKQELDIHNTNLTMNKSIQFASQIQKAFLPSLKNVHQFIEDRFILLKPKNELSGDFYWSAVVDNNLFIAIIDSSENNISGAILSALYFDALDTAVKREKLIGPQEIIKYLNEFIQSNADIKGVKDGIHISIVRFNNHNNKLYFSSEKNSLLIAKKNKDVIDEYSARIVSIKNQPLKYSEEIIEFEKGDNLYLSSDGFANHFEGFDNIKFKQSVLKSFLLEIKEEPMATQKILLTNKLSSWIADDIQGDDVCMVGIKF